MTERSGRLVPTLVPSGRKDPVRAGLEDRSWSDRIGAGKT